MVTDPQLHVESHTMACRFPHVLLTSSYDSLPRLCYYVHLQTQKHLQVKFHYMALIAFLAKNVLPHLQLRRLQFVRQATVAWLTSCSLACVGNKITLNTEGEADTFQFPQKTNCFVHFPSFFIGKR